MKLVTSTRSTAPPPTLRSNRPILTSPEDLQEKIRTRAYELFTQRGSSDGNDLSDWLQAESELMH